MSPDPGTIDPDALINLVLGKVNHALTSQLTKFEECFSRTIAEQIQSAGDSSQEQHSQWIQACVEPLKATIDDIGQTVKNLVSSTTQQQTLLEKTSKQLQGLEETVAEWCGDDDDEDDDDEEPFDEDDQCSYDGE